MASSEIRAGVNSGFSRRQFMRASGLGLLTASASGWLPRFAQAVTATGERKRQCILLWMPGAPSQMDTFDLKPGHTNGGEFKEIATSATGLRFSEHLPLLSQQAQHLAVVRSLSTREGDHGRGTYLMRTGQVPGGPVVYPAIGSSLMKELGDSSAELPNYVSVTPLVAFNPSAFTPGFLGPNYAAASVQQTGGGPASPPNALGDGGAESERSISQGPLTELGVDFLALPEGVGRAQADRRIALWKHLQSEFRDQRDSSAALAHDTVYHRALRVMSSDAASAFKLGDEPEDVRRKYGVGKFGQGCLLARRLIERGVPFVEVALDGSDVGVGTWDTHTDNFNSVRRLSQVLDAGWSTLMSELQDRGLLETTTILWMGEFGRTPQINPAAGRDHFSKAWTCVFAGGGISGGQAFGKTSDGGDEVTENPVNAPDVLATLCTALGVDPEKENVSAGGRPIKIVDKGTPIKAILS
jgi:Protein of unknown function (DUF1501)